MKRRQFLCTLGAASAISAVSFSAKLHAQSDATIQLTEPFGGAILHERFGDPVMGVETVAGEKRLLVRVAGIAPADAEVTVVVGAKNTADQRKYTAKRDGERFEATVPVTEWKNGVFAYYRNGDRLVSADPVRFIWLKNSFKRYRFQIDDNSFFLRDIHQNGYKSIFDCFYLKMLRGFHEKYGSKFVLNIFNATPERDFELSMMSDGYKNEWADHADWLRLAFHAETEFPGRPYENDPPELLKKDYLLVKEQIFRFAGEKTWTPSGIIHFAEVRPNCFPTLHELGVRSLSGYFVKRGEEYPTSFHLPNPIADYIADHDGWYDFDNGIVFDKLEMVVNLVPLPEVVPILEQSAANPKKAEMIDLLTHEQYFWPFYSNYIPEHADRMDQALRWVFEHDYRPVFHSDGLYSVPTDDEAIFV